MSRPPLVSIGVPVYNGERLLARTLNSLLTQTYQNIEVIICDNASTDGTAEIARSFADRDARVRYVRNPTNIGAIPNFLRTLELAGGVYFAWTAADDVRPARAIEHCVDALTECPEAVMVHGPLELDIPKDGSSRRVENRMALTGTRAVERVRAFTADLQHVGMMFGLHRSETLRRVHYGNHVAGDYFVCLQMCQSGPVVWTPSPILVYWHQYGAFDNPMYSRQPLTLRDLLVHRGLRRRKCWMVLGYGCRYLLRSRFGGSALQRAAAAVTFASVFIRRFRTELATEGVFLVFTPGLWLATPAVATVRWFRRTRKTAASVASR